MFRETEFVYDTDPSLNGPAGRPHFLRNIIDPMDRVIAAVDFDENGRIKETKSGDPANPFSQNVTYDTQLGTQTVTDVFEVATTYQYDARGNVTRIVQPTDPAGPYGGQDVEWTFGYDGKDRLISQTDPVDRVALGLS